MSYEFRMLGPVQLIHERRPIALGPAKRQAMLAALTLEANRPVSLSRLAGALWAGPAPASAVANLRTHAAALRRALGGRLIARTGAYELRVENGEVDAAEFIRLAAASRTALTDGDTAKAVAILAAALSLWRGAAGDGLPRGTSLDARLTALEEQRLDVFEDYVQARIAFHADSDVAADLRRHVAQHPLRERAWWQLMLVLYRSGNAAAALAAYAEARAALGDHLGIEPGRTLAALQRAILHRDPLLDETGIGAPAVASVAPAATGLLPWAGPSVPRQLPPDLGRLIGRTAELTAVVDMLRAACAGTGPPVVTVSGRGGVGKSALAVRAAHLVAEEFRDGQVVVDLRGTDPALPPRSPDDVVGQVLRAFGMAPNDVPHTGDERCTRYRSLVAGRRLLLLLDDAATAAQVRPLIPGGDGATLLVTARRPLTTLDGTVRIEVAPLGPEAASRLLAEHIGRTRIAADPDSTAHLVRLCAGLPLALQIVGARLTSRPDLPLSLFAAQLSEHPLNGLELDDLSVRERFAAEYLATAAEGELAARSFRLLGLQPGGQVTPQSAAAQLEEPAGLVFHALEQLVEARLAESPRPGYYRVSDLLRLYAAELAAADDPRSRFGDGLGLGALLTTHHVPC